ncbi:heat shock protein transcriptional repressor HspR [Paratractidigestivibacter sp.]|uniref:heat shock protein transcriptional repressor HspR n=1 Tax=Paratractidigestivibacter sp. TaxID=2847316 RepID=UPI002ABD9A14|nr:helix-turn-helix transcriptional regulator [Paratractidigestivibacter sp.]
MARNDADGRNKPLYMISVAAELTGMHPQTLRVYEQKGLVNPGRSRGNTRLYSQADIDRLNLISKLTDEGINLAGVVRIIDMRERELELQDEVEQLREKVRKMEDELREYRVQERITSLTRYESANPEQVMRKLLGGGTSGE